MKVDYIKLDMTIKIFKHPLYFWPRNLLQMSNDFVLPSSSTPPPPSWNLVNMDLFSLKKPS
jgi:hypothetical protein